MTTLDQSRAARLRQKLTDIALEAEGAASISQEHREAFREFANACRAVIHDEDIVKACEPEVYEIPDDYAEERSVQQHRSATMKPLFDQIRKMVE